jgi:hypothetical protein
MQGFGWRLPGHAYEEKVHLKRVLKWSTVAHVEFRSFVMVKKNRIQPFWGDVVQTPFGPVPSIPGSSHIQACNMRINVHVLKENLNNCGSHC